MMKNVLALLFRGAILAPTLGCGDVENATENASLQGPVASRPAAEDGDVEAQYRLGVCYYLGYGVAQDYVEAVKRFRLAAENGDADAQYILGVCYAYGDGVEQNEAKALKWLRLAAEQGNADAQEFLEEYAERNLK